MPNIITAAGLEVATRAELVTHFTDEYQDIYGDDINLSSDTPDGQMMGIFIQCIIDLQDLLVQIYNGFDPDLAIGVVLDQRVALNGIQRQAGTYTITNISVSTDRALNLVGLEDAAEDPDGEGYTVADNAGNQWILLDDQIIPADGVYVFAFRAKNSGAVLTIPNTIDIPVTVILGVTSVNNPTAYTTLGVNEETDAQLRIRRQKSVSFASQGYLPALRAALLNVSGVNGAYIEENVTGATDANGVPEHSIWVIVSGGEDEDIANAIYRKRNAGCGMKGDQTFLIDQVDGTQFEVKWDDVETEDLYMEFDVTSMNGVDAIDIPLIKSELVLRLIPDVFGRVDINEVATIVQDIDPNVLVTNAGLSAAELGPFTDTVLPTARNKQFVLDAANMDITEV